MMEQGVTLRRDKMYQLSLKNWLHNTFQIEQILSQGIIFTYGYLIWRNNPKINHYISILSIIDNKVLLTYVISNSIL